MTSKTLSTGQIYDQASNIIQQKLSQISGVGNVALNGASLPAIRIELNPRALLQIRHRAGRCARRDQRRQRQQPQGRHPAGTARPSRSMPMTPPSWPSDYQTLIVAYRNGSAVRLQDVAEVTDGVENVRNLGLFNGKPAILVQHHQAARRQCHPGGGLHPEPDCRSCESALPVAVDLDVLTDTTTSIRNAVHDVEMTLILSTVLVIVVVFLFLRNFKATLVPTVCVPLSLLGTFGVMYLLGFSLDNFSLMALIVSTGFVVDNTIVVLENVTRHLENGEDRMTAALKGAGEVSFTVLSMSISLVAVFLPVLLIGGIVGRIFHEFAVTLTIAIVCR